MWKFLCHHRPPSGQAVRIAAALMVLFLVATVGAQGSDIAFFYALDADLKAFESEASILGQPVKLGTRTVHRLECNGHRVYAVKMGSGAVETAITATALFTRFHCDLAFSLGPVGALDDALAIGEWYRVGQVMNFQKGSWDTTGFQMAPVKQHSLSDQTPSSYEPSKLPSLFAAAKPIKVASGEIFVASSNYRTQLKETSGAEAVDMNLFGLESVCDEEEVPLLSWRIVSDLANDEAGDKFRSFVSHYDGAGGKALAELIHDLPADPKSPTAYPALKQLLEKPAPGATP